MNNITIKINTENDNFQDGFLHEELSRILKELSEKIKNGTIPETLRDTNGNTVGNIAVD